MTNKEKIELANKLLLEVMVEEANKEEIEVGWISALSFLDREVTCIVVDYWYCNHEPETFWNVDSIEIDEYLCVEAYNFLLKDNGTKS